MIGSRHNVHVPAIQQGSEKAGITDANGKEDGEAGAEA